MWGSSTSSRTLAGHPADLPHLDRKEHLTTCHHSGPRTARQIRLFWWIAGPTDELPRLGLPTGTYSAFGFGGNFLTVLPTLDAVVCVLNDTGVELSSSDYSEFLGQVVRELG